MYVGQVRGGWFLRNSRKGRVSHYLQRDEKHLHGFYLKFIVERVTAEQVDVLFPDGQRESWSNERGVVGLEHSTDPL